MISDETFSKELDNSLKRQKIKIKKRRKIIDKYLLFDNYCRDGVLESQDMLAREFEVKQKELKHIPSEFKEQCDYVEWFKKEYKGVVIMSIRNGGFRTPKERLDQILEGMHPGAADLFILEWNLWVEFKRRKGGIQSEKQKEFEEYVTKVGHSYFLAFGFKDGKEKTENFIKNRIRNEIK